PSTSAAPRWNLFANAQPLGMVAWWLVIGAEGWLAFPALWRLLPGLPDRGYPLARVVGLLFAAWLAWLLASVKALPWARGTMLLALAALVAGSLALIWPRREAFATWLRENRRHLLIVEAGLAALFLLFVLIRLGNPDLWHPAYGGEKPMDLAYLNAVLRSESFPPYDPWFAGETINYYYFGFVIVGLPLKLLGVPTTVGYNLVLPTLFALTGGAAFSAALNLVVALAPRLAPPGMKPYVAGVQLYIPWGAACRRCSRCPAARPSRRRSTSSRRSIRALTRPAGSLTWQDGSPISPGGQPYCLPSSSATSTRSARCCGALPNWRTARRAGPSTC